MKILSMWPMNFGDAQEDFINGNAIFDIASFDIQGGAENTQYPHCISAWSGAETSQTMRSRYLKPGGLVLRRNGIDILLGYTRDLIDRSESNLIEWFLGVDVDDAESFASENNALVEVVRSPESENASDLAFIAMLMLFAFFVFHATLAGFNRVVSVDKSH